LQQDSKAVGRVSKATLSCSNNGIGPNIKSYRLGYTSKLEKIHPVYMSNKTWK